MIMSNSMVWQRYVLSNGLRVLLLPRQSSNTTQLSIAVEYGSNQDKKEESGVAHFIEHMLAGGSTSRIDLSRSIENNGGVLDFFTDHEHTMSIMDVLPEELLYATSIIENLFFNIEFEEEKFNQERKIILHEISEALDDPVEKLEELMLESLFRKHPIKRPVLGSPENIKRLTLNNLKAAQQTNYVPQNMILVLAGTFSDKDGKMVLEKFEKKKASRPFSKKPQALEKGKPKPLVTKKKAGITQAYLSIGARTVCSRHGDAPTLDLISTLLGGGTSSRLFIQLREKNTLTYDVNANHNKGLDFGFFNINCAVKPKNTTKAENLVLGELTKLKTEAVSIDELERNKNLIVAGILRSMDRSQEALEILTYLEMQYRSEKSLVEYISKIKAVSVNNIMEAANYYFQEDNLSAVFLMPK
jgi:predicted Zn-dependent peptidase